jgi:hypothetical protein
MFMSHSPEYLILFLSLAASKCRQLGRHYSERKDPDGTVIPPNDTIVTDINPNKLCAYPQSSVMC